MPRSFIIPPTRFTGRLTPVGVTDLPVLLTWESPRHELKYPYPGAPAGAERATDFFVNGFLRMTFNPQPDGTVIQDFVEMG